MASRDTQNPPSPSGSQSAPDYDSSKMRNPRKRRASSSSSNEDDVGRAAPSRLSIHKRRLLSKNGIPSQQLAAAASSLSNPLDILALAASSIPHLPSTMTLQTTRRRVVLLNQPFPSPLMRQNKFDLFARLNSHVDILVLIVSYLSPKTLLNLYSISAPFHYIMDSHFTAFIVSCTRFWAPKAETIYPWWCYRNLCMGDPTLRRIKTMNERRSLSWTDKDGKAHQTIFKALEASKSNISESTEKASVEHEEDSYPVRAIPSFRWLKMVAYRQAVSCEIIGWMAAHGHRIPRDEGVDAIRKLWFVIDIPISAPRMAIMHNREYITNDNLFIMQMFFIKLDMLYHDPIHHYGGEWKIRHYLFQERTLTTLWNYLRGEDGATRLDIMKLWVKHGYKRGPPPIQPAQPNAQQAAPQQPITPELQAAQAAWEQEAEMPIMGVPAHLVGRWGYECWGLGNERLLRPDELAMLEAIKRRLDLYRNPMRMIAAGYFDTDLQPIVTPKPEDVVLSLMCRKRNDMCKEEEEREMAIRTKNGKEAVDKSVDVEDESGEEESDQEESDQEESDQEESDQEESDQEESDQEESDQEESDEEEVENQDSRVAPNFEDLGQLIMDTLGH